MRWLLLTLPLVLLPALSWHEPLIDVPVVSGPL